MMAVICDRGMARGHRAPRLAVALATQFLCLSVAQAQSTTLPQVEVSTQAEGQTEGSGSYTSPSLSGATGLDLSSRETPQSASVVTRQRLDDENLTTIDDVLGSTAGITYNQLDNGARTTYRARGFDISNYKADGLSLSGASDFSGSGLSINLDLYDRVEIVRGANGLLGGTGDPSATINLVRKRPGKSFGATTALTLGSWSQKRLMLDLNAPLRADGSVRSRFVFSGEDSDTFRERENIKNIGLLASAEADLGGGTTAGIGFQYERNRTNGASWGTNVPIWYADGSLARLSRKTNPVADWSYTQRESKTVFADIEHRFSQGWKTRLSLAHTEGEAINNLGVAKVNNITRTRYGGFWNQDGTGAMLNAFHSESETAMDALDWSVNGPFQLLGRTHEFMAGFSGSRTKVTSYTFSNAIGNCGIAGVTPYSGCQYRAVGLPIDNWLTWDGSYAGFQTYRTNARTEAVTRSYGGYVAGRFELADPLHLITGARLSNYKTYTDTFAVSNASSRGSVSGNHQVVTPYVGLVYDLDTTYSLYASYTDVFKPQASQDVNGRYLDPITGQSFEAGIKGEFMAGALNASAAVFHAKQKNLAEADGTNTTPTGTQAYVANGSGVKSKGLELEASGALAPGWQVYAAYTYLLVDNPSATAYRDDPRHLLRLSTSYRLPGDWRRLTLGGSIQIQGWTETSTIIGRPTGVANTYDTPSIKNGGYALFGARASYQLSDKTTLSLAVDNLFDRTYYRQYGFYSGLIYGEPRKFSLTLRTAI